jgi:hypothetical protein
LLTVPPASGASSRNTACAPPSRKATGISQPIAAEGTIEYLVVTLRAAAAGQKHVMLTAIGSRLPCRLTWHSTAAPMSTSRDRH